MSDLTREGVNLSVLGNGGFGDEARPVGRATADLDDKTRGTGSHDSAAIMSTKTRLGNGNKHPVATKRDQYL